MPDLERLTREIMIETASTPEESEAYRKKFESQDKTRWELVKWFAIFSAVGVLVLHLVNLCILFL